MEDIFKNLIYTKKDMIYRLALMMLGRKEDAEDASSEVMLKLWIKRKQILQYTSLDCVIYSIARNHILDLIKKKKLKTVSLKQNHLYKQTHEISFAHESTNHKFLKIKHIIKRLPEKQQLMIHLRMIEGYSMKEIAQILDEKVNTVEVNISRLRKKIRDEYENIKG